jgi:hypothetical protein
MDFINNDSGSDPVMDRDQYVFQHRRYGRQLQSRTYVDYSEDLSAKVHVPNDVGGTARNTSDAAHLGKFPHTIHRHTDIFAIQPNHR